MAAWCFVFLAASLIIGSALILLRTANIPTLPEYTKDRAERQDEDGG